MTERIFSLIFDQDDVTWQSLLVQLVREEGMDPWDIDLTKLSDRYYEVVGRIKHFDVRISAKVVLAAAILLRLKSSHLIDKDFNGIDQLIASTEPQQESDDFYANLEEEYLSGGVLASIPDGPDLVPRTPQPRERKVSLDDLMGALRKALEVSEKRVLRQIEVPEMKVPEKRRDITEIIKDIYEKILSFITREKRAITFEELIPSQGRKDKIATFIPLLHLSCPPHGKIDLLQDRPFGTIQIVSLEHKA